MPSPPTARFGTGSLFDRSNTSPYNSPQALHSIPTSMHNEDAPPIDSLEDGDMFDGHESFQQQDYTSAPVSRVEYVPFCSSRLFRPLTWLLSSLSSFSPPPPSANPLDSTVIVFGPPMSMLQPLLQHFEQFGEITAAAPDQGGGNWVSITYRHEQDAARAIKKNGDVLGGSYMIGVKWADPSRSLFTSSTSLFPSPSTSPKPLQPPNPPPTTSGGGVGTPVRLAPSASAFRRFDQHGSSLVVPKPVVASSRPSEAQQAKSGVFGKLGELVFGF
ncbi:hypothetical protein BDY24DRAFT_22878 [Mrakia frigida]|uniref:FG-nucleoporin NUP53 n=1 Tax=Mrakia frigida TaxID=29902 RepID=UPI003FCBF76D